MRTSFGDKNLMAKPKRKLAADEKRTKEERQKKSPSANCEV